jgi:aminopeptidase YwaD
MDLKQWVDLLSSEISGARAKETVGELDRFHRTQASPGYDAAVEWVAARLENLGIAHRVHDYPADGKAMTYGWTAPPAWTVRSGSLWLGASADQRLATFDEIPQLVVVHSPPGRISGEVAHVERGIDDGDYAGRDVEGRIVLACGRASEVLKQATKRGALGVVVYPDSDKASASHDLVQYQGIFPKAEEIPALVPTFSISRRMADRLLHALRKGPVSLTGEVDAEYTTRPLRVLEAWIPGDSGAGEVLFSAHLCHPRHSANDNASGSAVLLELATAFQAAAGRGVLRGGVRFVWVPEFYGTLPWAATHGDTLSRCLYAMNLDMVGPSPDEIGEPLRIFRAANHAPSFVNALVEPLAEWIAALPTATAPYGSQRRLHWVLDRPAGGSDHLVFAAAPHRVPALMLGHEDPNWHTNLDTQDHVDSTRLRQVALLAGLLASVPSLDATEHARLADWTLVYSVRELTGARQLARAMPPEDAAALLSAALDVEAERATSLEAIGVHEDVIHASRGLLAGIDAWLGVAERPEPLQADPAAAPKRRMDGPLVYSVTDLFDEEERDFFKEKLSANHRALIESLLNLCDGRRSMREIGLRLSLDVGAPIDAETVERGIALLKKAGYVS